MYQSAKIRFLLCQKYSLAWYLKIEHACLYKVPVNKEEVSHHMYVKAFVWFILVGRTVR